MRDYDNLVCDLRICGGCNDGEVCQNCSRFSRIHDYENGDSVDPCSDELQLDAADAIEELLAELTTIRKQLPRWISVEDELPHYLDHVLCVNKYGIQMVGYLTDYKEGGFRCESGMDSCDYITHWMPLPEPPKGVE